MCNRQLDKELEAFLSVYQKEVVCNRTRTIQLLGRKCEPRILETLLGFELKLGRKRITCPDMSTARYLKIFAELGLESIRIPYDPSRTARILPVLERHWNTLKELLSGKEPDPAADKLKFRRLCRSLRQGLSGVERTAG